MHWQLEPNWRSDRGLARLTRALNLLGVLFNAGMELLANEGEALLL